MVVLIGIVFNHILQASTATAVLSIPLLRIGMKAMEKDVLMRERDRRREGAGSRKPSLQ